MKNWKRWIATLLTLSCLLTLLPMTASAESGTRSKGGKLIALTFDDGPGPYTNRLLDGLAARGVKVTFFMLGERVGYYPETVRRVYSEGHQIASHSYNHPQLSAKSDEQIRWQIGHTKDILNETLGMNFNYIVRPPYGDYNSRVLSALGAPAILWSVDPVDWKYRNAYTVRDNIVHGARDGSIVLAHDIHSTTVDGALMAIDILLDQGYEFVTVNELFRRRGKTLNQGATYSSCSPTGTDLGPVSAPNIEVLPTYGGASVRLTADRGADIYYTTDGSDPARYGRHYTDIFPVEMGQTVRACAAFDRNGSRSGTVSKEISTSGLDPTVCVEKGLVRIENLNPEGDVRYTTDGSLPTASSQVYTAPIELYDGVLRFFAVGNGIRTAVQTIYVTKNGNLFWDVPNTQWYFYEIDRAVTLGLFNGTGGYYFDPDGSMTRAMFVTTIYRLMRNRGEDMSTENTVSFSDVPDGQYYTEAVAWAAEKRLVLGCGDGTFQPDLAITREEMCVILDRLLTMLGAEKEEGELCFSDSGSISDWARESVAVMAACGIVNGRGNNIFDPQAIASRAEGAAVLLRLYDLLEK